MKGGCGVHWGCLLTQQSSTATRMPRGKGIQQGRMEADSDRAVTRRPRRGTDTVTDDEEEDVEEDAAALVGFFSCTAKWSLVSGEVVLAMAVSDTTDKNWKMLEIFMYCRSGRLRIRSSVLGFELVDRMGKKRKARLSCNRSSVASHSLSVMSNSHVC